MKSTHPIQLFLLMSIVLLFCFLPKNSYAFGCYGVSPDPGVFDIPVDLVSGIDGNTTQTIIIDMSSFSGCQGMPWYADALRTVSSSVNPILSDLGMSGFFVFNGRVAGDPVSPGVCFWPDATCSLDFPSMTNVPIDVKFGIIRSHEASLNGLFIPAGTRLATLVAEQRSRQVDLGANTDTMVWGWTRTWNFVLRNAYVVPPRTCSFLNREQTVTLPPITTKDLRSLRVGPTGRTPFNINLTCDLNTTVSFKMEGELIDGTQTVLKNTSPGNSNVGVGIWYDTDWLTFGETYTLPRTSSSYQGVSIPFFAYYYYMGGSVGGGNLSATATITLTYN